MGDLTALLVLLLLGWLWLDALRARELALALVRRACDGQGVQLLDQAVALRRVGLRWTRDGLRLRRVYRFEFSAGGADRQSGDLVLLGLRLEVLRLDAPPAHATAGAIPVPVAAPVLAPGVAPGVVPGVVPGVAADPVAIPAAMPAAIESPVRDTVAGPHDAARPTGGPGGLTANPTCEPNGT